MLISTLDPVLNPLTQLGIAGLMGAMWLWERRNSQKREQQLDEAHARIVSDRVQLDELIDLVRHNAEAMAQFGAAQRQLIEELRERREGARD